MWTPSRALAFLERKGAPLTIKRNRPEQIETFEFRLQMEAVRLRKQAEGMPAGIRRDELLQKARQADAAVHMNRSLSPSIPQP